MAIGACNGGKKKKLKPPQATDARAPDKRSRDAAPKPKSKPRCRKLPFADKIPLAEASGAVVVPANRHRPLHLLIIGDSGRDGELNEIAADDGRVLRTGKLPLDGLASDDLEGLTRIGNTFYAITSSGYVRHFALDANDRYQLTQPAYSIAGPDHPEMVCRKATRLNCAKNYEGLCALPDATAHPRGSCIGFAASKRDGHLYCVTLLADGRLRVDPARKIRVSVRGQLTGCHFSPSGDVVYAGNNTFGLNVVARIRHWREPKRAVVEPLGPLGRGFPEALAAGEGNVIYRFSDMGGRPSLVDKYQCD